MPYAKLGTNCSTVTNTLTSNKKYLLPTDPVYKKIYTSMYKFPGHNPMYSSTEDSVGDASQPEHVKAYYIKNKDNSDNKLKHGNCPSCKPMN
jgi:hypothetical protein